MSGISDLPSSSSSLLDDPSPQSPPESSQEPYMGRVVKALGEMLPPGENIEHLTSQIFTTQQQFSSSSSQDSCKEADFSLLTMITPTIGVSPNVICRINDGCKLGQGGNSIVFEGTVLPTEPGVFLGDVKLTPSKPPRLAIKQGKYSFSPEKRLLQQIPGELDRPLATFRNSQTGAYQSVHNRFDTTLTSEIDYSTIQNPALYAADQLSKAARGIEVIHTSGFIHGDIKGANIGVFRSGDVTITDFGTLWKQAEKRYEACGTTLYLAPFVFENAADQVIRFGRQTIQADLFAFGRTILRDVILVIFKQMTEKHRIVTSEIREVFGAFYTHLIPLEYVNGPDNAGEAPIYWPLLMDQIKKLQEQHPDKLVLYYQKGCGVTAHLYQIVMRAEEAAEKAKQLILHLSRCLPFEEVQRLMRLNDLARRLQQEDPAKIPDIQEV
jgi:serine/threonine protein kinase